MKKSTHIPHFISIGFESGVSFLRIGLEVSKKVVRDGAKELEVKT